MNLSPHSVTPEYSVSHFSSLAAVSIWTVPLSFLSKYFLVSLLTPFICRLWYF